MAKGDIKLILFNNGDEFLNKYGHRVRHVVVKEVLTIKEGIKSMKYKNIDLQTYPRKKHFEYFKSLAYPYAGITVNVEITDWIHVIKKNNYPFFHGFLYAVTNAANSVSEFRQRIKGEGIIEYDECVSSYTVSLENDTYCYCQVECNMPIDNFILYAKEKQKKAIEEAGLDEGEDINALYFISCVPWLTYTNIIQPVPIPADSNPRITWGKFFEDGEKIFIPVTVLCHHALVDGIHMNKFFENLKIQLEKECNAITKNYS